MPAPTAPPCESNWTHKSGRSSESYCPSKSRWPTESIWTHESGWPTATTTAAQTICCCHECRTSRIHASIFKRRWWGRGENYSTRLWGRQILDPRHSFCTPCALQSGIGKHCSTVALYDIIDRMGLSHPTGGSVLDIHMSSRMTLYSYLRYFSVTIIMHSRLHSQFPFPFPGSVHININRTTRAAGSICRGRKFCLWSSLRLGRAVAWQSLWTETGLCGNSDLVPSTRPAPWFPNRSWKCKKASLLSTSRLSSCIT